MTRSITSEVFDRVVKDQEVWDFKVEKNGVYAISVSAKCKNWSQNFRRLFNDDDLAVQIDDYLFAEMKGKKREFASPGSWNGNEIKNNSKTVLFILPLRSGSHKITFWVGGQPFVEEIKIYKMEESEIDLVGDGIFVFEKFSDIIIKNLTVEELKISANAGVGSNLEMKVDGAVEENSKYKRYKKWYWYGRELKGDSREYQIANAMDNSQHSFEFDCQGKPNITSFKLKIDTENVEYEVGYIKIYRDIISGHSSTVYLRSTYSDKSQILAEIKDGERVGIHKIIIPGDYLENLSEIWHEVIYKGIKGYILSSFIEIEGQERERIIDLIKEKCNQYSVDQSLVLSIASVESHFKPYARSYSKRKGIFQLGDKALEDVRVTDPYDFYQNIDGGVRYYKSIETRITDRGDVLIKRLVAWHDGPSTTIDKIKNKSFDYNKLSDETKSFIKSVLANIQKKDWYHIISIPTTALVILFIFSSVFLSQNYFNNKNDNISETANTIYSSEQIDKKYNSTDLVTYFPVSNENKNVDTSRFFSVIGEKEDIKDESSYYPNVFLDKNDNVIFLNSQRKIVKSFDAKSLKLEKLLGESDIMNDLYDPNYPNNSYIDSVVLENPSGVFYFSATNSYACGASNCTYVFYRFDSNSGKLEVLDTDIFGGIQGLYLSPDLQNIIWVASSSGGYCLEGTSMGVINLFDLKKNIIKDPLEDHYSVSNLENMFWKNNTEFQFTMSYQSNNDCGYLRSTKVDWLYNINNSILIKLDSHSEQSHP